MALYRRGRQPGDRSPPDYQYRDARPRHRNAHVQRTRDRDTAVRLLADSLRANDPGTAFLWAETISDAGGRDRFLQRMIRGWRYDDPDAARQRVLESGLPEATRQSLLQLLDPGQG